MFIEFKVCNYRSIGEEQILSLVPAPKQRDYLDNIIDDGKNQSLNVVAIYGANGSGKSNILSAIKLFKQIIRHSAHSQSISTLKYDPFLLRETWSEKPTSFEMTFSIEGERYRYGFEYNEATVLKEWLFRKAVGREVALFEREGDIIQPSSGLRAKTRLISHAIDATKHNALFLSTCDMFNVDEAKYIFEWLFRSLHIDGLKTEQHGTERLFIDGGFQQQINDYLVRLKLGPVNFDVIKEETGGGKVTYEIYSIHKHYDVDGRPLNGQLSWSMMERESSGSIKAFQMGGPIVYALSTGGSLFIDEIEAKMHPLITLDTIDLFLNKETNPHNAQLVFATHDTNLLTYAKLRRDQIYFAEKNNWESTEIYSLSDFTYMGEKERVDSDKEKRYIEGRYGAIPMLTSVGEFKPHRKGSDHGK
ncbi:AAA family ATPase [Mucilaginibacter auburnensis]|uniref:ATPase AAA-type core domain-containing protein n=1 Tax=Mucilaginibacter auburnensis TaxID=1457233 RepID=A0A2H9VV35_9SPHI|nr:ATP-binding protein [Mucilaginibacter auburnensis]PJJ84652.1 hypothetical protein CLV57_1668 [Mucilaginibacter auburnensis]